MDIKNKAKVNAAIKNYCHDQSHVARYSYDILTYVAVSLYQLSCRYYNFVFYLYF